MPRVLQHSIAENSKCSEARCMDQRANQSRLVVNKQVSPTSLYIALTYNKYSEWSLLSIYSYLGFHDRVVCHSFHHLKERRAHQPLVDLLEFFYA